MAASQVISNSCRPIREGEPVCYAAKMETNLLAIFLVSSVALLSPGPAVLAIISTALSQDRTRALCLAAGVMTASLMWSAAAAFGLGAIMFAHAWVVETVRILGGLYLLFLAYRSARSACLHKNLAVSKLSLTSPGAAYRRGLIIHLTNPKPVLFFGSLFALMVPAGSSPLTLIAVMGTVAAPSAIAFFGYALVFSNGAITVRYLRARRWIDGLFALVFGALGLRVLTSRLAN